MILITFGDAQIAWYIGNLDTIFGLTFWRALDVVYPAATIAVFLLYGWTKGGRLRINWATSVLFVSFLAVLALMNIDDIGIVLNLAVEPSKAYWVAISWIYPIYAAVAFLLFGRLHEKATQPNMEMAAATV